MMLWVGLVAALVLVLAVGSVVIAWFSMHPPRYRIRRTPGQFGASFETVTFASSDGTRLNGWWIPAANARAVLILCHGMSAHRAQMLSWAEWLCKAGFSLLLFDFRALGESEGSLSTMGLHEAHDVVASVDYVKSRPDTQDL